MGVQKEILRRTFTGEVERWEPKLDGEGKPTGEVEKVTVKYSTGTAALVGGTPGQIYDVAYGPVVHTTTLAEAADIGSFVKGQGIIINAPEYALYGTLREGDKGGALAPSLTLPAGTVVSCMTAGHVWVTRGAWEEIKDNMFSAIIAAEPKSSEDEEVWKNDLIVIEVNGMASFGPDDSSSTNG